MEKLKKKDFILLILAIASIILLLVVVFNGLCFDAIETEVEVYTIEALITDASIVSNKGARQYYIAFEDGDLSDVIQVSETDYARLANDEFIALKVTVFENKAGEQRLSFEEIK